jgi:pyrroloquinoline quinone biosynthesis protein D
MNSQNDDLSLEMYPYPASGVVGSRVGGEAVIVLPEQARVKVLNEVGARIWELADGSRSVAEIADQITREYQVDESEAHADTRAFINTLLERGLLRLSNQPLPSRAESAPGKGG